MEIHFNCVHGGSCKKKTKVLFSVPSKKSFRSTNFTLSYHLREKMTAGWVYVAESTREDGSKSIYTGMTTRSPYVRWGEHIDNVRNGNKSSWVGKGTYFKPLGAVWSSNAPKAEKTIKSFSSDQKRSFGSYAARRYYGNNR
jgi:predicted GIY-YIG superfamily endonuclease